MVFMALTVLIALTDEDDDEDDDDNCDRNGERNGDDDDDDDDSVDVQKADLSARGNVWSGQISDSQPGGQAHGLV